MISVLITAYKEPHTINKAMQAFLNEKYPDKWELLVAAGDSETFKAASSMANGLSHVKIIRDERKGKPAALNLLFKKAKGDILILSDGDVEIRPNAVQHLIASLNQEGVGAVTGRPISINSRKTILGYWSHLLTDIGAHKTRLRRLKKKQFILCSGYLFAMKKLFSSIPEDALSDDAVMSHLIAQKGYTISYAPTAKVFVTYPKTFSDWILQKRRSAGGYRQIPHYFNNPPRMRTFWKEAFWGTLTVWQYPKSLREMFFTFLLFPARLYLWLLIFKDINIGGHQLLSVWKTVESTK